MNFCHECINYYEDADGEIIECELSNEMPAGECSGCPDFKEKYRPPKPATEKVETPKPVEPSTEIPKAEVKTEQVPKPEDNRKPKTAIRIYLNAECNNWKGGYNSFDEFFRKMCPGYEHDKEFRYEIRQMVNTILQLKGRGCPLLEDVKGRKREKAILIKELKAFLDYSKDDLYDNLLRNHGVLSTGGYGLSKTHTNCAVANQMKFAGYKIIIDLIDSSTFAGNWDTVSETIAKKFEDIRKDPNNLYVTIWDEMNATVGQAASDKVSVSSRVNLLREYIGGAKDVPNLWIFGTTNYADMIDSSFLQGHRMGRTVLFDEPKDEEWIDYLSTVKPWVGEINNQSFVEAMKGLKNADWELIRVNTKRAWKNKGSPLLHDEFLIQIQDIKGYMNEKDSALKAGKELRSIDKKAKRELKGLKLVQNPKKLIDYLIMRKKCTLREIAKHFDLSSNIAAKLVVQSAMDKDLKIQFMGDDVLYI
jgi:hypothetical protein